jgi:ATP-dependent DNA helicase RecG
VPLRHLGVVGARTAQLLGEVQDTRFLRYLEKLGAEKVTHFSPHDFIALDIIKKEQALVPFLIEQGAVERVGKGKLILSKDLYAFLGERGSYTRKKGLAECEQRALLQKHIDENPEGCELTELQQVLPSASASTVKRLLQKMRADGKIHITGERRWALWKPGVGPAASGTGPSSSELEDPPGGEPEST